MCSPENQFYEEPIKIVYVPYGLANRFDDRIELHEDLKKYPKLFDFMLQHEMEHTDKFFSFKDLWLDLTDVRMIFQTLNFVIRRPSTWRQFNPFYKTSGGRYIDWNLIIVYILSIIIFGCAIYFLI